MIPDNLKPLAKSDCCLIAINRQGHRAGGFACRRPLVARSRPETPPVIGYFAWGCFRYFAPGHLAAPALPAGYAVTSTCPVLGLAVVLVEFWAFSSLATACWSVAMVLAQALAASSAASLASACVSVWEFEVVLLIAAMMATLSLRLILALGSNAACTTR
jgi:hypothetical protein